MRHWDEIYLLKLQEKLRENLISSAEFVGEYLLHFLLPLKGPLSFQQKKWLKNWSDDSSMMNFINDHHWKGHNDRIRRSLLHWHTGLYPLVLWDRIPTPFELLQIQSEGQRVVTVFLKPEEWDQLHHGKNVWDFVVHDLIHADHFFEKPDWRLGQMQFYRFLLENWDSAEISALHNRPDFEYVISDMNSHPRHLLWTLQAIALKAQKESLGLTPGEPLPPTLEKTYQSTIQHWSHQLLPATSL